MEIVQVLLQVVEGASLAAPQTVEDASTAVLFLKTKSREYFMPPHAASRDVQELIVSRVAAVMVHISKKFCSEDARHTVIPLQRVLSDLLYTYTCLLGEGGTALVHPDVASCVDALLALRTTCQGSQAASAFVASFADVRSELFGALSAACIERFVMSLVDDVRAFSTAYELPTDLRDAVDMFLRFGLTPPRESQLAYAHAGDMLQLLFTSRFESNLQLLSVGLALLDPRNEAERVTIKSIVSGTLERYNGLRESVGGDLQSLELEGLTTAAAAVCKGYVESLIAYEVQGTLEQDALLQEALGFFISTAHDPVSLEGVQETCRYCDKAGDAAGVQRIVGVILSSTCKGAAELVPTRHDFLQEQDRVRSLSLLAAACDAQAGAAVGACLRNMHKEALHVLSDAVRIFATAAISPSQVHCFSDFLEALFDALAVVVQRFAHGLDESDDFAEQLVYCLSTMLDTIVLVGRSCIKVTPTGGPASVPRGVALVTQLATHHVQVLCKELSTDEVFRAAKPHLEMMCNGVAAVLGCEGGKQPDNIVDRLAPLALQDQGFAAHFVTTCSTVGFAARAFNDASAVLQASAAGVSSISEVYKSNEPHLAALRAAIKPETLASLLELLGASAVVVLEEGGDSQSILHGAMECCGNCLESDTYCLKRSAYVFMSRVVLAYGDACCGVMGSVLTSARQTIEASERSTSNTEVRAVELAAIEVIGDAASGIDSFDPFLEAAVGVLTASATHPHPRLVVAACYALERVALSHISTPDSPYLPPVAQAALHVVSRHRVGPSGAAASALASVVCPLLPADFEGLALLQEAVDADQ